MRRIGLAVALSLTLALPGVGAQQADRIARIGYLAPSLTANAPLYEAFRQGLRELGYVDGRNLAIESRDAGGKGDRLPALAAELVALKVDVLVTTGGTLAALAAKQATDTIPIVMIAVGEPVTSGLVNSLARPGANLTGLSLLFPELVGKCLELLKQAAPRISRVAVLRQPGAVPDSTYGEILKEAGVAARALRVRLQVVNARGPGDIDKAFLEMTKTHADALVVLSTAMFMSERRRLVNLEAKNRLPTVHSFRGYVDAGGLMSYGPDLADMSRRAATYVDKILKGAKPADLPVEQPTKFELVINLKTAKVLGITIPQSLLQRADHVIE